MSYCKEPADGQPSIYDPPAPTQELIREDPTPLESGIRDTRRQIFHVYSTAKNTILDGVDKWIGVERKVERTLKEIAPKGEETLLPGAVYVGIAGMGGSIIARNRTSVPSFH
jgi:MICOS complex subunit MIC26